MAFLDAFTQLSNAQAVTTSAASTNVIDTLSELGGAIESGAWLRVGIQTSFTIPSAPTSSMQIQLQGADEVGFNTGAVTHAQTAAITGATLVAGYEPFVIKLPKDCKRWLRVYYIMGSTATAGNIDAHIVANVDSLITGVEGT